MSLQVFHPFALSVNESHPVLKLTQAETSVKAVPHFYDFFLQTSRVLICTDVTLSLTSQIWKT